MGFISLNLCRDIKFNVIMNVFSKNIMSWRRTHLIVLHLWWIRVHNVHVYIYIYNSRPSLCDGGLWNSSNVFFFKEIDVVFNNNIIWWLDYEFSKLAFKRILEDKFIIYHEFWKNCHCPKNWVVVKLNVLSYRISNKVNTYLEMCIVLL